MEAMISFVDAYRDEHGVEPISEGSGTVQRTCRAGSATFKDDRCAVLAMEIMEHLEDPAAVLLVATAADQDTHGIHSCSRPARICAANGA